MSLTLKKDMEQKEFTLMPVGTHAAICSGIFDFGPQETEYNGEIKEQNKVRLVWQVPAERITWTPKDGEETEGPMSVGKTYTASFFKMATLFQHLESWRGKAFTDQELTGFDLKNVLGAPCMIGVTHDEYQGKKYAKITSVSPLVKGMTVAAEGELQCFDFDAHSEAELDALPDWMKEKVMEGKRVLKMQRDRARSIAEEEIAHMGEAMKAPVDEFEDSDIPF